MAQNIIPPPEGYKPAKGAAWCPYCGEEKTFVYDSYLSAVRCEGCGISTEDFYVRKYNGFFAHAEDGRKRTSKDRFEEAVKASGWKWQGRDKKASFDQAAEVELPLWEPLDLDGDCGSVPLRCPECGAYIRHGYYPATNLRCVSCGVVSNQESSRTPVRTARQDGHFCPRCGALLTRVYEEEAAYWCPSCSTWSTPGASKKALKLLEEAKLEGALKVYRKGPLPGSVLVKARQLAAECANFFEGGKCLILDGPCVFTFASDPEGGGSQQHRCRWFEQAVLPLEPALQGAYTRPYEGASDFDKEGKEALQLARKALEKPCPRCGRPFVPKNNFDRYCSDFCKKSSKKIKKSSG